MALTKEMLEEAVTPTEQDKEALELLKLVIEANPKNSGEKLEIVAAKIAVVDVTNSTQLHKGRKKLSLYKFAEIISGIGDLDDLIKAGDPKAVTKIVEKVKGLNYTPFSLATKYCCYHNRFAYKRNDFSIIDSTVIGWLVEDYFADDTEKQEEILQHRAICDYEWLYECIGQVISENNLDDLPAVRTKLDAYIYFNNR